MRRPILACLGVLSLTSCHLGDPIEVLHASPSGELEAAPQWVEIRFDKPVLKKPYTFSFTTERNKAAALHLQAEVHGGTGPVTFLVDDNPIATVEAPHVTYWPVTPGRHAVRARFDLGGQTSAAHEVVVY